MIWNKSEIKPETNHSIIFLTENNKFCTLSEGNKNLTTDWKWLVDNDLNFTGNILMSSTTETLKFDDVEFRNSERDNLDALDD